MINDTDDITEVMWGVYFNMTSRAFYLFIYLFIFFVLWQHEQHRNLWDLLVWKTFSLWGVRSHFVSLHRMAAVEDKSSPLCPLVFKSHTHTKKKKNFHWRLLCMCVYVCVCVCESVCPFTLAVPRCTLNHPSRQLWCTICANTHTHTHTHTDEVDRTFFNAEPVDSKSLSWYFITLQRLTDIEGGRVEEKEKGGEGGRYGR